MKKFVSLLTVVIVAAVLAVALAACNNATTQGQLVDAWKNARPYQRYTYSVTDSAFEGSEGEYVSVITYHKAYNADENSPAYNTDRVIIGGRTIEQREGYLISNTLYIKLGDVEYHYVTECYFILTDGSNYLLPYATHRSEKVNGEKVFSMDGTYNGSSLAYTLTANGESKSGNIGLNSQRIPSEPARHLHFRHFLFLLFQHRRGECERTDLDVPHPLRERHRNGVRSALPLRE